MFVGHRLIFSQTMAVLCQEDMLQCLLDFYCYIREGNIHATIGIIHTKREKTIVQIVHVC